MKRILLAILILLIVAPVFAGTGNNSIFAFGKLNRSVDRFSYVNFRSNGQEIRERGSIFLPDTIVGNSPLDAEEVFKWNFRGNIYSPTVGSRTYTTMYLEFTLHGLVNAEGNVLNYYYMFAPEETYYDMEAPDVVETMKISTKGGADVLGKIVCGTTVDATTDVVARFAYRVSYEGQEPESVWNRPGRFFMYIPSENAKTSSGEYTGEVFVTISVE